MMGPAERSKVVQTGLARRATFVGWHPGFDVVEVAGSGVATTSGKDAGRIALDDVLPHGSGRIVRINRSHVVGAGQVEHWTNHDPATGQPGLEQLQADRAQPLNDC